MTGIPEGSVVITPAEVYTEVVTLTKAVTKLLATDEADARERARVVAELADHGREIEALKAEIGSVKQKLWFVAGLASAGGAGLGSIVAPYLVR